MGRRETVYIIVIVFLLGTFVWYAWTTSQTAREDGGAFIVRHQADEFEVAAFSEPIQPIPLEIPLNEEKVELGERLFHDPLLSRDNSVSCASCHGLHTGGTDRKIRSVGVNGATGFINTPTVFNSGFQFKLFWDGRAETLEEQIDGPLLSPHEMGSRWDSVVSKLQRDPAYVSSFEALYPSGISPETVKDAIATFERSLYTPNSRFDRFLRGEAAAITPDEKKGYDLFKEYGCIKCHHGRNVGGNHFDTFGVMGDYFSDRGNVTEVDLGRFNVTGDARDKYQFKVCSLRNVALTAPYFHDGSARTLEEAVAVMARYQLGRNLSVEDISLIVQFLHTLTGEYRGKPL